MALNFRRTKRSRSVAPKSGEKEEPSGWPSRNFYVVEINGMPTELYRTDLLQRARQHSAIGLPAGGAVPWQSKSAFALQQLDGGDGGANADECRHGYQPPVLLRVTDRWREEWSHGVQMPWGIGGGGAQSANNFERTELFPHLSLLAANDVFELPSELVTADGGDAGDGAQIRRMTNERPDKVRHLRLFFERKRNLCHMVQRRERMKRQCLQQFERHVRLTASNVGIECVPTVSTRRTERQMREWQSIAKFGEETETTRHNSDH
ncbi:hypothetical protein niasHT_036081 [Heterodera trifolii]|uniref:Uncharacterized protein n=1 Tax=Heterodera trifolii TaxID=157864 RepID=A0ABD2I263_9BILA